VSGGTAPYTYSWTSGASTAAITGLDGGPHTVTVTDTAGAVVTATVTLIEPALLYLNIVAGTAPVTFVVNGVGGIAPTYMYSFGPTAINGGALSTVNTTELVTGFVTVVDQNGCVATAPLTV